MLPPHSRLTDFLTYGLQETSYTYHSIEGQMRALADLAYLLGQYEFAVQSYRLAAQDYLSAPNSKWYAGAEVRSSSDSLKLGVCICNPFLRICSGVVHACCSTRCDVLCTAFPRFSRHM